MGESRSRHALIPQRCLPATLGATRHTGSYQRVLGRPLAYLRHGAEGGGVWGSMQQQEKASGFAIQLPSNLLSSKAASLRGRPVFPLYCVCSDDMVCK